MKRHADIVVLCEDRAHANFVRHYLKKRGYDARKLRFLQAPEAKGSAKAFVLNKYPDEVNAHRSRATYLSVGLVAAIDADAETVQQVHNALRNRLTAAGCDDRRQNEKIACLIPKRNIQTWIVYLMGEGVDEEQDYKNHAHADSWKAAAEELGRRLAVEPTENTPNSLKAARPEFKNRFPG